MIVFVFGLSLELCARIDDWIKYDAPFFLKYTNDRLRSYDEDGLRYNVPNARFEKWQNNSFGFRGQDFDIEKPRGVTRIFCMGASETYGLFESPDKEWPAQLSDQLKPYSSLQVINAATVGLRRDYILKYLDKYVYKFDPDIIIFLISPSFIDRQNKSNPIKKNNNLSSREANISPFTLSSMISNIRIIPKIWQMIKKFIPKSLLEKYQHWDRSKKIDFLEKKYLNGENPLDSIPFEYQKKYKADIDNIISTVNSKGIKVILCTYPYLMTKDNIDIHQLIFMEGRRFNIKLSYAGMIDASKVANDIVKKIADERNTGFIDCNKAIPKNLVCFGDNVHLTNEGSKILANMLANYITSHY